MTVDPAFLRLLEVVKKTIQEHEFIYGKTEKERTFDELRVGLCRGIAGGESCDARGEAVEGRGSGRCLDHDNGSRLH